MREMESTHNRIEEEKRKIRKRYRGIAMEDLDVIPAKPKINFFDDDREKRVAVYARVSTDSLQQTSSYELQRNHYMDTIERHPGWTLTEIYADEGISGTSLKHREAFNRMIKDCEAGKIDLIITKSVSRFARNILDCVGVVRALAALPHPVEVFFETEGIHTLSRDSEMQLSFLATLAQEESHNKSDIMNSSIEMRFARGIFLTPVLLGYDHDEEGNLIINESEAETVKLIFFMYLYGNTLTEISETLTSLGRRTKKGNTTWSTSSILQILQNERHCGDVLAHKTWTPNYLDHKSKKNVFNCAQYRKRNHHEAIISRDDFNAVQKIIQNAKYGHKGFLPELQVIHDGALRGYVVINPRWAGFKPTDYYDAISTVIKEPDVMPDVAEATTGDFDLRGFQIARSQFFTNAERMVATFTTKKITFNSVAVNKLETCNVELLVNPYSETLVVRCARPESRNYVQWAKRNNTRYQPKIINGAAFLPTIFELLEWNTECKYRLTGVKHQNEHGTILVFDFNDTEIFVPDYSAKDEAHSLGDTEGMEPMVSGNSIVAYPATWADSFGTQFYQQQYSHEATVFDSAKDWELHSQGKNYQPDPEAENVTPPKEVFMQINTIIDTMRQEVSVADE